MDESWSAPPLEDSYKHWSKLDEELAITVMGWKLVQLTEYPEMWPAWPRETKMRLTWMVEDPEDTICSIEAEPGTGIGGHWQPMWIPRLSTDLREMSRVSEAVLKKGGHLNLMHVDPNEWGARFDTLTAKGNGVAHKDPAMAIAMAALIFCKESP
jgi:hypothetical protein